MRSLRPSDPGATDVRHSRARLLGVTSGPKTPPVFWLYAVGANAKRPMPLSSLSAIKYCLVKVSLSDLAWVLKTAGRYLSRLVANFQPADSPRLASSPFLRCLASLVPGQQSNHGRLSFLTLCGLFWFG